MKINKIFWIVLGCISVGCGAIGAFIPMLPTVPFLLIAAFSFARSSEKLHKWFINTKLYKDNLHDYADGRGMTLKAKIRIIFTITFLMSIGFIIMALKDIWIGCLVLGFVWLFHIIYFIFYVKTLNKEKEV